MDFLTNLINWKNRPYWLKGISWALIFAAIFAVIILNTDDHGRFAPTSLDISLLFGVLIMIETIGHTRDFFFYWPAVVITHLAIVAIIGALIGYLYGKIKNRNLIHNS